MSLGNLKDFLTSGAFLQTGPDEFKILIGPFRNLTLAEALGIKNNTMLYMPEFWDFLRSPQTDSQEAVYCGRSSCTLNREDFIQFLSAESSVCPDIQWQPPEDDEFRTQFEWSHREFAENRLIKTVPVVRQAGPVRMGAKQLLWCIQRLVIEKNFGWAYGFCDNGCGLVGRTPEMLVDWKRETGLLQTVALAGTYAKSESAAKEILRDPKIRHEHEIVIDDIRKQLSGIFLRQGPTEVLELKHLLHLITHFETEVSGPAAAFAVVHALHPTAAMGLYPRNEKQYRRFCEFGLQKARGYFSSPFAFFDESQIMCVVAIRNLMFDRERATIFSGCGVTAESDCEQELTELCSKRDSVKKMLGLMS